MTAAPSRSKRRRNSDSAQSLAALINDWPVDYYKEKHLDPIYGEIQLQPYQQCIVATPHFNRLRDLKQMGAAHHVFTNANHTRFSHCIGVAYRATQMYRHLTSHSLLDQYDETEEMLVVTAAMCHDLGHGPHSHSFECWARGKFDHEQMSVELVKHAIENDYFWFLNEKTIPAVEDASADNTDNSSVKLAGTKRKYTAPRNARQRNFDLIRAMIIGVDEKVGRELLPAHKFWLFQIVHNAEHGIDVDKMDYLIRDMHSVYGSVSPNVRMSQIIDSTRIVDGRIRFNVSACNQLYEMLYLRASMHKNVYTHDSVISVKHMFLDLLDLVDKHSADSISTAMQKPSSFLMLSDCVFKPWNTTKRIDDQEMTDLMHKIQTQQYYTVLARCVMFHPPSEDLTVNQLLQRYRSYGETSEELFFEERSLFIVLTRYDLGNGVNDPLAGKVFYRSTLAGGEVPCYKTEDTSSCFFDSRHSSEYLVRLYCKHPRHQLPVKALRRLTLCFQDLAKRELSAHTQASSIDKQ